MDNDSEAGLAPNYQKTTGNRFSLRLIPTKRFLYSLAYTLLPSFLWLSGPERNVVTTSRNHSTAYMDGLRGMVSILVFVRHFNLPWQQHLDYGYGYDGYNGLLRLPFLRLSFSGPLVPMFFILSGYVLSVKPFKLARKGSWEPLVLSLAGSVFRRGARLFLPPLISTFCVMILAHLGLFSFPYDEMPGREPTYPPLIDGIGSQLLSWIGFVTTELTNPWRWDVGALRYGPHLWTIPLSFKGSLVVYLTCLALLRVRSGSRLVILGLEAVFAISRERWDMALFVGGMFLCELDLRTLDNDKASWSTPSNYPTDTRLINLFCLSTGLYVASFPRYHHIGTCATGYQMFCLVTDNYHYWHALGAFLIMAAMTKEDAFQRPFTLSPFQYFGNISFAMYIIHEPLLHLVGFHSLGLVWGFTGNGTSIQYQGGLLLAMIMNALLLVWLADLFHRHVEQACGEFADILERFCFMF